MAKKLDPLEIKIAELERRVAGENEENEEGIDITEYDSETIEEEIPEAFIPSFTIAPEDIPLESQVKIPTEEEQKTTIESLYKKLGLKAKEFIESPPQEMTPEKERFTSRTSLMGARIMSAVTMWGFSIFGYEYGILAPTVEQSQHMIEPAMRIVARHSKVVGNISPDLDDAIESLTAVSEYAVSAMALMQQIREDKALNNGRYTGNISTSRASSYQARPSSTSNRRDDILRSTSNSYQPVEDNRDGSTISTNNLTPDEQFNRDMLRQLSVRDFQTRARRSGRL